MVQAAAAAEITPVDWVAVEGLFRFRRQRLPGKSATRATP